MPTILLVDDDTTHRDAIRSFLEYIGYSVIPAENGKIALFLIRHIKSDLILSDKDMPLMTGLEFLQTVKADERLKAIPFVMFTRDLEESSAKSIRHLGAEELIRKPVDMDRLQSLIDNLLLQ
jgi:CheY-like chemotaxis protein